MNISIISMLFIITLSVLNSTFQDSIINNITTTTQNRLLEVRESNFAGFSIAKNALNQDNNWSDSEGTYSDDYFDLDNDNYYDGYILYDNDLGYIEDYTIDNNIKLSIFITPYEDEDITITTKSVMSDITKYTLFFYKKNSLKPYMIRDCNFKLDSFDNCNLR